MKISGLEGRLYNGYRLAAILGRWEMESNDLDEKHEWHLKSTVSEIVDAYWFEYGDPYRLILLLGKRELAWDNVSIMNEDTDEFELTGQGEPKTWAVIDS